MAYKGEYEVARLLTDSSFWDDVRRRFDGGALKLHLAPPILFGRDPASGRPRKRAFSARYLLPVLRFLARGKVLRGSALDPFGWMRERRVERMLRDRYFALVEEIVVRLNGTNLEAAVALASYPNEIRGYGPVKDESVKRAVAHAEALRAQFSEASLDGLTNAA